MAGTVKVKFDADAQKTLQALDKQNRKLEQEIQKLRQIKGESKKTSDSQVKGYGEQGKAAGGVADKVGSIKDALVGAAGVSTAIATVRQGFQLWKQDVETFSQEFRTMQQSINSIASDFRNQPLARAQFRGFASGAQQRETTAGTTLEQRTGVLSAFKARGLGLNETQLQRYGFRSLETAAAGFDPEMVATLGAAILEQVGPENMDPLKLQNLTVSALQEGGTHPRRVRQMVSGSRTIGLGVQAGLTPQESTAFMLANLKATNSTEASEAAFRKALEHKELKPVAPEQMALMSDKELLARQFYFEKDPRKRIQMISTNPLMAEAVLGEMGPKFGLTAQRAPGLAGTLTGATGDVGFTSDIIQANFGDTNFMAEWGRVRAESGKRLQQDRLGLDTVGVQTGAERLEDIGLAEDRGGLQRKVSRGIYEAREYAKTEEGMDVLNTVTGFGPPSFARFIFERLTTAIEDNTRVTKEQNNRQSAELI